MKKTYLYEIHDVSMKPDGESAWVKARDVDFGTSTIMFVDKLGSPLCTVGARLNVTFEIVEV